MLAQKDNWGSLFLLTFVDKEVKDWDGILSKTFKTLEFKPVNTYLEPIKTRDNKDGTYRITSGHWKGRLITGAPKSNIQIVKTVFQKKDKTPFTISELGSLREYFRKNIRLPNGHLGLDYYPYKDKFKIDKGLPKWPSITNYWGWALAAIALGSSFYYNYAKEK